MLLFLIGSINLLAQNKFTISGTLKDALSGEDLLYASVYAMEKSIGVTSNEYGYFSLSLPEGKYTLKISYIGYQTKTIEITLDKNKKQNIELKSDMQQLTEVTVTAKRKDQNVSRNETGVVELKMNEVKEIPVIFGEQDIIKTMQLMPGVSSAGEGGSGFHVRGGSVDQNLILLDEAPVFNASHLLGFFSVFNSDAIKDMKMYKGGMPAQFGGRASSVLDLRMKDGNMKQPSISGGLGLISSRLTFETPIVPDRGSIIISGRRTYLDIFLPLVPEDGISDSKLYFYDLNIKANYQFGENDRVFISTYFGRDVLQYKDLIGFNWGNSTITARWNHLYSEKLFSNITFIKSNYDYEFLINDDTFDMTLSSNISDIGIKAHQTYFMNANNTIRFGIQSAHRTFSPGIFKATVEDIDFGKEIQKSVALESAAYISNEQKIGSRFKLGYGLRFSWFNVLGGRTFYKYDDYGEIRSQTEPKSDEVVKTYYGLEPRLNATYILSPTNSIKLSYNRMVQYLHLMSNTTAGSPTDYWIPSSENIKPQKADQIAVGYFQNLAENKYEISIESYIKKMQNMIEYKNGSTIMLNEHIERDLEFGEGRAYGVELMIRKNSGKLTGWISYTLSKTEKLFDKIDKDWFPAKYDKTHDISLVSMYKLSKRWSLSASWVFQTGAAVTFPAGIYEVNNVTAKRYTKRNAFRMPDYHRLDLGATYKIAVNKKHKSELTFSLYNAYGRENAYQINFSKNEDTNKNEAIQVALFSFIPSITWNFKF